MDKTDSMGRIPAHHLKIYIADIRSVSPESGRGASGPGAESAMARKLALKALSDHLGLKTDSERIKSAKETRSGTRKPCFPDYPDFHYSISHSGGLVVCGTLISSGVSRPVGIDIQEISEDPKRVMKIADHFFSDRERASLHALLDGGAESDIPAALLLFNRLWTARESYMKLTGRGLAESFRNFRPDLEAGRIVLTSPDQAGADASADASSGEIFLTECPAPEGFCLTACSYVPITKAAVSVVRV